MIENDTHRPGPGLNPAAKTRDRQYGWAGGA